MIGARWQRCVQNAPRRWRNAFAPRMVRCNAAWLLFKADVLALRGNCFPRAMQALNGCLNAVDGVKGQRAAHTPDFSRARASVL